ncbi:MAG: hypothetical protein H6Q72_1920 [Firmicutes bacterium]|nr:hypothetical protein [Bacillota bacterium]
MVKKYWKSIVGLASVALLGYFIWQHLQQPRQVTTLSQVQAEKASGVELAAKNAHIVMLQSQLNEAANQIAELKNKTPDTIVSTVPVDIIKTVEVEQQKVGADITIVTDRVNPDKQVNLEALEKLPANTQVNLNQYNVFAYKKVIRGVNVYPDWEEAVQGKFKLKEVTVDINRRISKDGKYIGIVAGCNFKHNSGKVGIRYSY